MKSTVARRLNAERHTFGKPALKSSRLLRLSAQARARHLARTGILEHGRWWKTVYRFAGHGFERIGENIASGQDSAPEVVAAWMASKAHRENILGHYTHVGVGQASRGDRIYWVTHFGKE